MLILATFTLLALIIRPIPSSPHAVLVYMCTPFKVVRQSENLNVGLCDPLYIS